MWKPLYKFQVRSLMPLPPFLRAHPQLRTPGCVTTTVSPCTKRLGKDRAPRSCEADSCQWLDGWMPPQGFPSGTHYSATLFGWWFVGQHGTLPPGKPFTPTAYCCSTRDRGKAKGLWLLSLATCSNLGLTHDCLQQSGSSPFAFASAVCTYKTLCIQHSFFFFMETENNHQKVKTLLLFWSKGDRNRVGL